MRGIRSDGQLLRQNCVLRGANSRMTILETMGKLRMELKAGMGYYRHIGGTLKKNSYE